jgi:NTP pyrophosphatase (non-canonical NTP hydrolase)
MNLTTQALCTVADERCRQDKKWGKQRHAYPFWLTILVEEVGEVAQAMQKNSFAYKFESDADDLHKELIQVAAVAVAIAEQVDEERSVNRDD